MNLVDRAITLQRSRSNASLVIEKYLPFVASRVRERTYEVRQEQGPSIAVGAAEDRELIETADSILVDKSPTQEIEALSIELFGCDISLDDLADASPRSASARRTCAAAVRALLVSPEAFEKVTALGVLPMIYLTTACHLPRKTLNQHRKYILATAVISAHNYPRLSQYVSHISGGQGQ